MNLAVKLKANKREDLHKGTTRSIREAGRIPAVVYGNKKGNKTISVDSIELLKTVRDEGKNAIISLDVEGESVDVMLHDYQIEPLRDELVHADFYIVNMSQEMDVQVAIHLEGEATGSKEGGVLQQPLYELSVRAKPADIPEQITIDISDLNIGDSIMVSDLKEGRNYEILEDENTTIATVTAPDTAEEETTEEEETEPEIINERSTEEEE